MFILFIANIVVNLECDMKQKKVHTLYQRERLTVRFK